LIHVVIAIIESIESISLTAQSVNQNLHTKSLCILLKVP